MARTSVIVTAKLVVLSYVVQTPISMALGLFTAGRQRYRSVYATIYVLPLLLSTAGIALMWESLLDPSFGALSALAKSWHLSFLQQNWLGSPDLTLYVVVAIIAWQFIPFHTLLYAVGRTADPGRAVRGGDARRRQPAAHVLADRRCRSCATPSSRRGS